MNLVSMRDRDKIYLKHIEMQICLSLGRVGRAPQQRSGACAAQPAKERQRDFFMSNPHTTKATHAMIRGGIRPIPVRPSNALLKPLKHTLMKTKKPMRWRGPALARTACRDRNRHIAMTRTMMAKIVPSAGSIHWAAIRLSTHSAGVNPMLMAAAILDRWTSLSNSRIDHPAPIHSHAAPMKIG